MLSAVTWGANMPQVGVSAAALGPVVCVVFLGWVPVLLRSHEVLEVASGQDVTLECSGPARSDLELLMWVRLDRIEEGYVYFHREDSPYESYQVSAYVGRVSLRESSPEDMSIVLKEVNPNDAGTYECRTVRSSDLQSTRREVYYETKAHIRLIVKEEERYHQVDADPGQDVVLPCLGPKLDTIQLLQWSRLDQTGFIYVSKPGKPDQIPIQDYRHRVHLRQPQLTEGNASLVLKNVGFEDSGTYVCFIQFQRNPDQTSSKLYLQPQKVMRHIITLTVPGSPVEPPRGLSLSLKVLVSVLILGLCGALLYMLQKRTSEGIVHDTYGV